jgi:ankyrin repeat protein
MSIQKVVEVFRPTLLLGINIFALIQVNSCVEEATLNKDPYGYHKIFYDLFSKSEERLESTLRAYSSYVNTQNIFKETPLHVACKLELVHQVSLLLKSGANPNIQDINGDTPLHYAIKTGNPHIVGKLSMNGANVNASNVVGLSPFEIAISRADTINIGVFTKYSKTTRKLHSNNKKHTWYPRGWGMGYPDEMNLNILRMIAAVEEQQLDKVKHYLSKGVSSNVMIDNGWMGATSILEIAIGSKNYPIIKELLIAGANSEYTKFGLSPIISAIDRKDKKLLKILLDTGSDPNKLNPKTWGQIANPSALWMAIQANDVWTTKVVSDAGAFLQEVNYGTNLIGMANEISNDTIVKILSYAQLQNTTGKQ